jgi:hypothetical protein
MWGKEGRDDGQLLMPWGVSLDTAGNVYVVDVGNARIQKFSPVGALLAKWGAYGDNVPLRFPSSVAVDAAGLVYVVHSGNYKIQVYGPGP